MNTTIKLIDVFGQFENQGTGHYYTYLPGQQEAPTGWKNVMKDPRNEVSANLEYCYATWCTSTDWWIAKMVRNPHDPKGGFAMLSLCLGSNRPVDGKKAAFVLDNLAQFFIIEKHWDDADAEKALINQEQDLVLMPCTLRRFVEPTAAINSAYRSFETKEQLGWYLSFLPQPGYEEYSRIFFVPKESEGMPVKCLDNSLPLKKIFTLKYPDDNCVSSPMRTEIMEGEDLKIVYNKFGLEPVERIITGGKNTDCAFVVGTEMQIRPEREVDGLVHNRVITIKCQDNDGRVIDRFKLNNYTRQFTVVKINGDQVILPESFSERVVLDVIPSDDRYETRQEPLDLENLKDNIKIVVLGLKDYKVVFRMGSEDFETNRTMNPATARTRWSGFESEVDNAKKTIYFRAYGKPTETINTTVEEQSLFDRFPWLKYVIVGLLALLLGYGIYAGISKWGFKKSPWPFGEKIEVTTDVENGEASQGATQPKPEEAPTIDSIATDTIAVLKEQDVDYLKNNNVWSKSSIQSNAFQKLYDAIASGDVNEVVQESGSLFVEGVAVNGFFSKIIEGCKIILEKNDQQKIKKVSDEMKRIGKDGNLELGELLNSVNSIVKRLQARIIKEKEQQNLRILISDLKHQIMVKL